MNKKIWSAVYVYTNKDNAYYSITEYEVIHKNGKWFYKELKKDYYGLKNYEDKEITKHKAKQLIKEHNLKIVDLRALRELNKLIYFHKVIYAYSKEFENYLKISKDKLNYLFRAFKNEINKEMLKKEKDYYKVKGEYYYFNKSRLDNLIQKKEKLENTFYIED